MGERGVDKRLGDTAERLLVMDREVRRAYAKAVPDSAEARSLRPAEVALLLASFRWPHLTLGDLAKRLDRDDSTIRHAARALAALGLLEAAGGDGRAADGRARLRRLTSSGEALAKRVLKSFDPLGARHAPRRDEPDRFRRAAAGGKIDWNDVVGA